MIELQIGCLRKKAIIITNKNVDPLLQIANGPKFFKEYNNRYYKNNYNRYNNEGQKRLSDRQQDSGQVQQKAQRINILTENDFLGENQRELSFPTSSEPSQTQKKQ